MIRCLSLTQPWASLVATGQKKTETRGWEASWRGLLGIHASKGFPTWAKELVYDEPFTSALKSGLGVSAWPTSEGLKILPLGSIIAVCRLTACFRFTESQTYRLATGERLELAWPETAFGDFTPGRYGFLLADVVALPEPIPAKGSLGLWTLEPETEARLLEQFAGVMG